VSASPEPGCGRVRRSCRALLESRRFGYPFRREPGSFGWWAAAGNKN